MLAGPGAEPDQRRPDGQPGGGQARRRDEVLDRMHDLGHITDQEAAAGRPSRSALVRGGRSHRRRVRATPPSAAFFCDYLQRYLTQTLGLTQEQIDNGGLHHPDHAATRTCSAPATQAVLNTLPMGDCPRRHLHRRPARHRPPAGHERTTGSSATTSPTRRASPYNLNSVASQGAGSTYKVFTAAAALEQGYSQYYTLTTGDPYISRVYRDGAAALRRRQRRATTRATLDLSSRRSSGRPTPTSWPSRTPWAPSRRRCGWPSGRDVPVQPAGVAQQIIDGEPRVVHPRRRGHQPAGPGQRLLDVRRQRHPCDRHPGDRVLDRSGQPLLAPTAPLVRGDQCTPEAIARRGRHHDEPDPAPGRRAREPGPDRVARLRRRAPDRRQDRDVAGQLLRHLRRLHPRDHRQRDGAQPEAEPGRRRLRRQQAGDHLARRRWPRSWHAPGQWGVPAGRRGRGRTATPGRCRAAARSAPAGRR